MEVPIRFSNPDEQKAYEEAYERAFSHGRLLGLAIRKDIDYQETFDNAMVIAKSLLRANAERQLDPKTKLLNYPAFVEQAKAKVEGTHRSKDRGRKHVLIMADLDDFKRINTRVGYTTADKACLIPTSEIIRESIREYDDLATRFGGEEFVILLTDTDAEGAQMVADRIRSRVNSIDIAGRPLGISMGIATLEQGDAYETIIERANLALLEAKTAEGKNQVLFAS